MVLTLRGTWVESARDLTYVVRRRLMVKITETPAADLNCTSIGDKRANIAELLDPET